MQREKEEIGKLHGYFCSRLQPSSYCGLMFPHLEFLRLKADSTEQSLRGTWQTAGLIIRLAQLLKLQPSWASISWLELADWS